MGKTRMFWVPDLSAPIDFDEAAEIVQDAAPWGREEAIEVCRVAEALEREPLGPEGTLTEAYDEEGRLIGHAEVSYNGDGTGTAHIYGLNHNPEEQR